MAETNARRRAGIGCRAHSGWAVMVAVSGTKDAPQIIDRRRVELITSGLPKQPYHAAEKLGLTDAQRLIRESANAARNLARHALRALVDTLGHEGYSVTGVGIALSSGRTLGALAATLASHAMIHTAEGELFRNALIAASEQCQLPVTRVRERDLFAHASNQLGTPADKLRAWLADLGRPLGPPWRVDEKISALRGCLVPAQP